MNFNYNTEEKTYNLFGTLTNELISLYGVQCKFIRTTKFMKDDVFGDFRSISANADSVFEIALMPESTENWGGSDLFSKFGLQVLDQMNFFISAVSFTDIYENEDFNNVVGDLLVFENGKFMEITGLDTEVAGGNNMFTYSNTKNVYMLKTRSYHHNRDSKIDIPEEDLSFEQINDIFTDTTSKNMKEKANTAAKTSISKDSVFGNF